MAAPTEAMLRARRSIVGAPGVVDAGSWYLDVRSQRWTLDLRLQHGLAGTALVPAQTVWHAVVDNTYPWGEVRFYPAAKAGVQGTHPHQRFNPRGRRPEDRVGEICVSRPDRATGRVGDDESYEADERLAFLVERVLDWIRDATRGTLALAGEWFELPDFPGAVGSRLTLAFLEGARTLASWTNWPRGGIATLCRYGSVRLAKAFAAASGAPFHVLDWGALEGLTERESAIWLRLDRIPVATPFQPPSRFSDLATIFGDAGRDVVKEIIDIASSNVSELRDEHGHLLLLGFPIPRRIGEPAERMHWQAIQLPALTSARSVRGFRPGRSAFHELDRAKVLRPSLQLNWIASENWMDDNLVSRGALPDHVSSGSTVVIGCGALGSVVAELLVRGGSNDVVLVDHERFEAGNAVRHVLTLDSVGNGKAGDLAKRLNLIRPSVRVRVVHEAFPPTRKDSRAAVAEARRVVDTTGSDSVMESLSGYPWGPGTVVVSVAVGYRARRLFSYSASADRFTSTGFREAIEPWLQLERREPKEPFPRPGIGCWSPAFPARPDDMCLMAAAAVKCIEAACMEASPRLRVLEQPGESEHLLVGLREVVALPS